MSVEEFSVSISGVQLLCTIIFCAVLFVVWDLYRKRHMLKFSRKLNGYKFYPIIGNVLNLDGLSVGKNLKTIGEKFKSPVGVWVAHSFHYITADVEEIKVILNHQHTFDKHSVYKCFEHVFKNSLLLEKVDRWKNNRKAFAKCFSQPILQTFVDIFYERSCILIKELKAGPTNDLFDVFERLSFENFCATIMGLREDEVIIKNELPDRFCRVQKFLENRLVTSYLYPDFIAFLTQEGKMALQNFKRMTEIVTGIVQKKRETYRAKGVNNGNKQPFFDVLLEGTFDEDDIISEITLFMGAGTDTSGGTLAFTFTLLGMNPHVQEKIYLEVEEVVGNKGPISYDDLSNLKYTERAIRESMRLLPITPLLGRHATADVDLGTRTIPAGSDILISVFHLHRLETYWPDPLKYNPDRFLPEEVAKRHPYCYIPFSGGPRNCIGMKYAMLMMKMTVANVIRSYHVTSNYKSVEDFEFASAISMKTTHELDCVFTPRAKQRTN